MTAGSFTLARDAVRDLGNLSIEAVGLLAWLSSHTDRFIASLTEDQIRKTVKVGRDKCRRMLRELADAGYLLRTRLADRFGFVTGVRYTIDRRANRQMSLPLVDPEDGFSVQPADQAKRDVSAGGTLDGFSGQPSMPTEEQTEENKELRRDAPHNPPPLAVIEGAQMPRKPQTKPDTQMSLWPTAVPDLGATPGRGLEPVDPPTVGAHTIIGEWLDRCPVRPPGRVIGQVSKLIKEMVIEGLPPDVIRRGVASWMGKGLHPATLPAEVNAVANAHAAPARRRSTTDDRVAATLALADQLDGYQPAWAVGQ